jgi:hypothetical protein
MPTIIIFEGIKISIYPNEHNPPHFHVDYSDYHSLINISDLTLLKGELPSKILKKVIEWAKDKQIELLDIFKNLNLNLR